MAVLSHQDVVICEGSPGKQMHLDQEIGGGGTKGKVFCSRRGAAQRGFRVDEGLSQAAAGGGPSAVLIQAFTGGETTWEDTKDRRGKDDDRQRGMTAARRARSWCPEYVKNSTNK